MKKKAALKLSLTTIISLVLVSLALLALYKPLYAMTSLFSNDPEISETNFDELVKTINNLNENEKREIPLYIEKDYFIMAVGKTNNLANGFNYGSKAYKKPLNCNDMSCMCLCHIDTKKGCNIGKCTTKLDEEFEFKSSSAGNNYAIFPGKDKPQVAYISKIQKNIQICTTNPC